MARDYGKVSSRFWTGDTGREIRRMGRDAQVVALYLMTCPMSNMIGLYYLPLPILCHETGMTLQGASKALRSLSEAPSKGSKAPFCLWDEHAEHVFIVEMAAHQVGEPLDVKDNRTKSVLKEWQALRKSPFYKDFHERYAESFHLPEPAQKASPFEAPSKPLRSQEQEQEKEQEQEQKQTPCSPPRGTYAKAFLVWWEAYPRKTGKDRAHTAWKRAGKRIRLQHEVDWQIAAERMLDAAKAFAQSETGKSRFCPHPATWLNAGQYDDDRSTWDRAADEQRGPKQVEVQQL